MRVHHAHSTEEIAAAEAAFDPQEVVRDAWGTLTVTFNDCGSASVALASASFGDVAYDVERLAPLAPGATGDCDSGR